MAFAALGAGDEAAELFAMLNPINHSRTRADAYRYKVGPYVVCADVYSCKPHVGRGGRTWRTGSAGCRPEASRRVSSRRSAHSQGMGRFETDVRYRSARYRVSAENPDGVNRGVAAAEFDEVAIAERPPRAPLVDDGAVHRVKARLGRPAPWRTRAIRLIWRLYLKPFDGARPPGRGLPA